MSIIINKLNNIEHNSTVYISNDLNYVLSIYQYTNIYLNFVIDETREGLSFGLTKQEDMIRTIKDLYN